jgi:hypothetical protein
MKRKVTSTESSKDKPVASIDIEEARRELRKFVEEDEEPPQEKVCVKEATSMKRIVITVLGTKDKPHGKPHIDFLLHPGITAGQILDHLKLKDYVLFPLPNPFHYLHLGSPAVANTVAMLRAVINFKDEEEVDSQLIEGHGVIAVPSSKAKAYIRHIVYGSF